MLVAVRSDDPAEKVQDTKDYIYGIQKKPGEDEVINKAMEKINEDAGAEVMTAQYNTLTDQAAALLDKSVEAIVYDEGYGGILDEVFEGFNNQIKIIGQYSIEVEVDEENLLLGTSEEVDVTEDTFSIYISGIDVFGPVATKSRSDVNIIATINPKTKQILLTNTPRDYYVQIPEVSGEGKDKLTHAGIYGVDTCVLKRYTDPKTSITDIKTLTSLLTIAFPLVITCIVNNKAANTNKIAASPATSLVGIIPSLQIHPINTSVTRIWIPTKISPAMRNAF